MRIALTLTALLLITTASGSLADEPRAQPALPKLIPTQFECHWAHSKITIDGKAQEKVWSDAPWISTFYLPWLGDKARLARTSTKAKLLWDREYVYFFAEMEDGDLYADVKEQDGRLWDNDVFELFFKPADDKPGYYEFQVNPANAKLDLFMPRRGAGGYARFKNDFPFEFDSQVQIQGTLNRWQDKDKGWMVEGRISWKSFIRTGGRPNPGESWKFTLCRYDYSVDFEGPELSTCAPLKSKRSPDFHHFEDYATLKFVGPGQSRSQLPQAQALRKRPALTTSKVIGSPEPAKPYRVTRAYPNLKMDWPVCIDRIPGTDHLLVINEARAYAPARLHLVKADNAVAKSEALIDFEGVAYDVAFHPQFHKNGFLFVGGHSPIGEIGPHCYVIRYTLQTASPFRLDPKSAKVIIEWPSNGHNGAAIDFGIDGMLYVTTGDGTVRRDTDVVGQRLDLLRAKVLRLNVDEPAPGKAYSIPKDNPFVKFPGARPETWCYGLRNPWRITVDQKTGHVWVGNNGQDAWEQIYLVEKGANYGWSVYEGGHPFILERTWGPTPILKPTFDHPHSEARSLTGGIVYHGNKYPELRGAYLYGDYSTGKIWAAKHDGKKVLWHKEIADTTLAITCFATNKEGEILIADHRNGGGFYRLEKRPVAEKTAPFPKRLSETGLFVSVPKHQLEPGIIPYSVNAPGWHDGAILQRYLAVPASTSEINLETNRGWDLPDSTVLIQTLLLETKPDRSGTKRVETRLLTKQEGEWAGYSYLWNDQQTDADLVESSGTSRKYLIEDSSGKQFRTWHVPSRTECMSCHSRAAKYVLGMTTLQMNHEHNYGTARLNQFSVLESQDFLRSNWLTEAKNQWRGIVRTQQQRQQSNKEIGQKAFDKLVEREVQQIVSTRDQRTAPQSHLLSKSVSEYPSLPNPFDEKETLDRRARSYLHANCAHCHVLDGGGNARIVLEWGTPIDKMNLVNVAPMHGDFGIKEAKLIVPGTPEESVLVYRLASSAGGRMPRLGSHQVDTKGLALIQEWIAKMGAAKSTDVTKALEKMQSLPPKQRQESFTDLLSETKPALELLLAIENNRVAPSLAKELVEVATVSSPPSVRDLFERFLPEEKRIRRLGTQVNPDTILRLTGDVDTGKRLFFSKSLTCVNCHQMADQGQLLGPDLTKIGAKHTREKLLENVLNPSKLIEPKFATYAVQTKRGRIYVGLLLEQSKEQITIKDVQHKITRLAAGEVESVARQTQSLMPDLLLKDLTAEEAAHLLAYLSSLK